MSELQQFKITDANISRGDLPTLFGTPTTATNLVNIVNAQLFLHHLHELLYVIVPIPKFDSNVKGRRDDE